MMNPLFNYKSLISVAAIMIVTVFMSSQMTGTYAKDIKLDEHDTDIKEALNAHENNLLTHDENMTAEHTAIDAKLDAISAAVENGGNSNSDWEFVGVINSTKEFNSGYNPESIDISDNTYDYLIVQMVKFNSESTVFPVPEPKIVFAEYLLFYTSNERSYADREDTYIVVEVSDCNNSGPCWERANTFIILSKGATWNPSFPNETISTSRSPNALRTEINGNGTVKLYDAREDVDMASLVYRR